jgi:hypothetical protein
VRTLSVLLATFLALAAAATAAEGPTPRLAVSVAPLTVRGSEFAPRERVRVDVAVGRRLALHRHVRATREGRFTLRFELLLAVDPCEGAVVVTASGDRGSRATYRKQCRPPSTRPPSRSG